MLGNKNKENSQKNLSVQWLKKALEASGLSWRSDFGENVDLFVDKLIEANRTTNMTGMKKREDIYRFLIFDSLMLLKMIPDPSTFSILDFGTGAGFPGVPIKLYFPQVNVLFLDSNGKKIRFLEKVTSIFGWGENPLKLRLDKQNKMDSFLKKYDIITVKAVGSVDNLASFLWPYLKPKGKLIFFIGPSKEKKETLFKKNSEMIGTIEECTVPELSYKRRFYFLTREELSYLFT